MEIAPRKFRTRTLVFMMLTLSMLGLPVTGIINHQLGFSELTAERHFWMSAHNALGLIFVVFGIWHIIINRRSILNHVKNSISGSTILSRETLVAGFVFTLASLFVMHAFVLGG